MVFGTQQVTTPFMQVGTSGIALQAIVPPLHCGIPDEQKNPPELLELDDELEELLLDEELELLEDDELDEVEEVVPPDELELLELEDEELDDELVVVVPLVVHAGVVG